MPTCIYCLRDLPKEDFNKEHVVPQQLGSFLNCPVLLGIVCTQCNSYFGDNLELAFGRHSIEALYRLQHGQRPLSEFKGFNSERLQFRIPSNMPDGGVILMAAVSPEGDEIIMELPPQVGVNRPGEAEYHYHTEEVLIRNGIDQLPPPDEKVNLRLLAADDAGGERIRALVLARYPKFREHGKLDLPLPDLIDGKRSVEIKSKMDRLLARAIAKIAFNYMAFHAGAKFALRADFNQVRQFIRYDERGEDWRQCVGLVWKPLLGEETKDLRITRGHILILGWRNFETLVVWVSPYNSVGYGVTLTKSYRGVWQPLQIGQVFDWEDHKIFPLVRASRVILPVGWGQRAARVHQSLVWRPSI